MRDIVGHFLEAVHQGLDPLQHEIEIDRQPVEFVAGTGHRQPLAEIAGHDAAAGLGHSIDAAQHATRHEQAAGKAENDDDRDRPAPGIEHDVIKSLALVKIAADQHAETAGQLKHAHQRMMIGMILVLRLVETAIAALGPAGRVERAGL